MEDGIVASFAFQRFSRRMQNANAFVLCARAFLHSIGMLMELRKQMDQEAANAYDQAFAILLERPKGWMTAASVDQVITTTVEGLDTYIADVIGDLYWSKPALVGSEQVRIAMSLPPGQYRTSQVRHFVEGRIGEIAKWDWERILDRIVVNQLGLEVRLETGVREMAKVATLLRHAFVHRDGRATRQFIQAAKWPTISPGDMIVMDFERALGYADAPLTVALEVDQTLMKEFGLSCLGPRWNRAIEETPVYTKQLPSEPE